MAGRLKPRMKATELKQRMVQFGSICRQAGLRITPQRVAVYEELISTVEHPSADEICQKVRVRHPNVSLDTVNRTLLTFSEKGIAGTLPGSGDARRFDGNVSSHQHFKCTRCGKVSDIDYDSLDKIEIPPQLTKGFEIKRKSICFEGLCPECLDRG